MARPYKVLIVDDHEAWRRFISTTLQKRSETHAISEAYDGSQAVQAAQQIQPDLILLDIGLPILNGIEAARQIRDLSQTSKILFISENRSWSMAEEALRTGAKGYVVKSDAGRELLPAINAVLEGKRFVSTSLKRRDSSALADERGTFNADRTSPVDGYALKDSIPQASLESILCTEELHRRPRRAPDYEKENRALVTLVSVLSNSPNTTLQTLAETILDITQCDSAGLSLLTRDGKTPDVSGTRFYWPAIAGMWSAHVGAGSPRNFGPCGDVLDQNRTLLFKHFERRYPYLPATEECLLVPFHTHGKAVGTIWAIMHSDRRKFDAEDDRVMASLGKFASSAYQALVAIDDLTLRAAEREKVEAELRELTDGLEEQVRIRTLELQRSGERLRLAQQAARIGTFEWNIQTGVNTWTPELEELYGLPTGGFVGTQTAFENLVHPDDRAEVIESCDQSLKTGKPTNAEWRVVWPDGSVHWIAGRWQVFMNGSGAPSRMIGVNTDVTERKLAEDALRESEQRFRLVANTAPVMIWMSGQDRRPTYFNQFWLDFTGLSETDLQNGLAGIVHPDDYQQCHETYCRGFDQRQPFKKECRLRRHDGQYRWMLDLGVPRFHKDGSFAGYIGTCIDVTDQKLAEEVVSGMARKLVDAQEQERARIARELHDDINQRLAMLAVELEQLQDNPSDVTSRLQKLRKQTIEISSGVQALSHDLHSSQLEYLGVVAGMRGWCSEFGERQKLEIDFSSDVSTVLPFQLGLTLFRVLQEALHNAVKHSGVRRFVVQLREDSGEIHLVISDLGKGFDVQAALQGKGLGLISMRERVRLVNGTIAIESKPMCGTSIHARIPLESERAFKQTAV
jgi:PAS domain S-box-containing protein